MPCHEEHVPKIFYTKAAREWSKDGEDKFKKDGYLAELPEEEYQRVRKAVFEKIKNLCAGDAVKAQQAIIDAHTLPELLDREIVKFEKIENNTYSVVVPVIQELYGQSESCLQQGLYEVIYHKTPQGHYYIYHKVFKMVEKDEFINEHLAGQALDLDQRLIDNAGEDDSNEPWQAAQGTWTQDATSYLYTVFDNAERGMRYYVPK